MTDLLPLVFFAVLFCLFFGLFLGAVIFNIVRLVRAGSLENAMLGGKVVHSFDELTARSGSGFVKSRIRLHRVETVDGPAVGVILTQSGWTFWRRTGFSIDRAMSAELVRQIQLAVADTPYG